VENGRLTYVASENEHVGLLLDRVEEPAVQTVASSFSSANGSADPPRAPQVISTHVSLTIAAGGVTVAPFHCPAKAYRIPNAVTFFPFLVLNLVNLFPPTGTETFFPS